MLTLQELSELISDLESDRVERTLSTKDTDKFAQAICAFSNDLPNHRQPGYLIVGVDDQGQPSGLKVTDQLLQNVAAIRSDGNVQPLPAMNVQKYILPDSGHEVAVVEVLPSDIPPVRYKGRTYIRIGPRRAIATEQEERILTERRTVLAKSFDSRPCIGSTLQDINQELFSITYLPNAVASEVRKANNRKIEEQLASLRFYDLSKSCPTFAGILMFGIDPLAWIPGAYIQFVRFQGMEITDEVILEQRFSGDLLTVLREIDSFIPLQIQKYPKFVTALREEMTYDYPIFAVRELLMNAVMHRMYDGSTAPVRFYWFSDHIEIQSPGGLYGEVTPENFPKQNSYRNPVIAEAMKVLGYVNQFGSGVIRAQQSLRKNKNPEAEFKFNATYVLATIRERS